MKYNKKAQMWKMIIEIIALMLFLVFVAWLIYKSTKGNLELITLFTK